MRVAIIHHQWKLSGGMETYLFDLLQGFRQRDSLDVFVAKLDPRCAATALPRLHRVPLLPLLPRRLRPLAFARKVAQVVCLQDFDLVLSLTRTAHQHVMVCGGTHRGFLRALGKPPGLFDRLEMLLECRGFQRSAHVVAHSRSVAAELITLYGVEPGKVHLLYPPVNTTRFTYTAAAERRGFRRQLGLAPRKTTVLFPGAGHARKGYCELLRAFAMLPLDRFELLVAGGHPARQRGNVRHLGFVKDMRRLYGAVDFTILPSKYEPFGLAVAESLQCGTPVIVSTQVGAGELLGPEEGYVLPSLEPGAMAEAIQTAAHTRFRVEPEFARRNELTVDRHVRRLRQLRPGARVHGSRSPEPLQRQTV
jgi:glycosyltransferase involved in cell wall biosynthesis